MTVTIPTDVGDLVLTEDRARRLIHDIESQIPGIRKLPAITQTMLDAGVAATWFTSYRWRRDEVVAMVKRVYEAMRPLE